MSEMIERVAKVIYPDAFDPHISCDDSNCPECNNHKIEARKMARAAIEAMREPTEEMKNIFYQQIGVTYYKAMIDAALKE